MDAIRPRLKVALVAATALILSLISQEACHYTVLGAQVSSQKDPNSYPGLSEVIPKAEELEKRASETRLALATRLQTHELREEIKQAQMALKDLGRRLSSLGDPTQGDYQRLLDLKAPLESQRRSLEGYLSSISEKIQEIETLKRKWEEDLSFWTNWKRALEGEKAEGLTESFARAERTIKDTLGELSQSISGLVFLQEEVRRLLDENRGLARPLDLALARMRQEAFRRTEPSFFEKRFIEQILVPPWKSMAMGVAKAMEEAKGYLGEQGGIFFIQVFVAVCLGLAGMWKKKWLWREGRSLGLWAHPWALAIVVVGVMSSVFLKDIGGAWKYLSRSVLAFAVIIVWLGSTKEKGWKAPLFGLTASLTFLDLLKLLGVTAAWYRVCLAGVALMGIPAVMAMPKRTRAQRTGLNVALAVLLVVSLAQVGGFATLSERIFQASGWSVLLILVGRIAVFAAKGAVDWVLVHPRISGSKVLQLMGSQVGARLFWLISIGIWMMIALRLLTVWGFYESSTDAFEGILRPEITIGKVSISLGLLLLGALAIYLGFFISRLVNGVLDAEVFPRTDLDVGARHAIGRILHYVLVLIGFLMAMSLVGIHLESFLVLGGALGVGIGFGLQHVANNFISGLILLFERPVKVGDTVQVENQWGRVKRIGLRSTIIETFDRSELIVPNSQLVSSTVVNWTLSNPVARVRIPVGVAYGTDLELAMKLLIQAAKNVPRVLEDPPPNALFLGFGDSSLSLELHAWVGDIRERLSVQSELCREIDRLFRLAGVEIPYPQRDLHIKSFPGSNAFITSEEISSKEGKESW